MERLFFGLFPRPDEAIALAAQAPQGNPWRTTPADQLHVTLRFIGAVDPDVDWFETVARDACFGIGPLSARTTEPLWLPSRELARVFGVGLNAPSELALLAERLDASLAPRFGPASHSFSGHLTLARFNGPRPEEPTLQSVALTFDAVRLVASTVGFQHVTYRTLFTLPLHAS